jgi:hypothetical protein|tara:strand:+ start:78 stop:491 length:414 start_codon:yes stop_codon:yes gene_type:complete
MFDDWKWKFGQPNPEPQIGAFQGMQKNPNVQSISPHINRPQSPTYGNVNTFDEAGYNTALDRWGQIEDEKAKQQALFQEMALGTPSQTSAAQGGSVGKPTDLKTSIFDVSSGPKNTMATLEDFNVPDYPFLKRWRNA